MCPRLLTESNQRSAATGGGPKQARDAVEAAFDSARVGRTLLSVAFDFDFDVDFDFGFDPRRQGRESEMPAPSV
jgi:hypothetical protein